VHVLVFTHTSWTLAELDIAPHIAWDPCKIDFTVQGLDRDTLFRPPSCVHYDSVKCDYVLCTVCRVDSNASNLRVTGYARCTVTTDNEYALHFSYYGIPVLPTFVQVLDLSFAPSSLIINE
jgi:hypothetical protein